jgi:hypothetical protein
VDYSAISQKFFRPERPRFLEALECVLGRAPDASSLGKELMFIKHKEASFASGRSAWASLASRDLIPMKWVDDSERLFHQGSHKDLRCHPSPLMSVLLAADLQGVVTVENMAREALARGRYWGRPVPSRVLWRLSKALPHFDHDHLGEMPMGEELSDLSQGRRREFPISIVQRNSLPAFPFDSQVPSKLLQLIYNHRWWEFSVQKGRIVTKQTLEGFPSGMKLNPEVEGRLFSELPNPFTPALDIWKRGYALMGLTEEFVVIFVLWRVEPMWGINFIPSIGQEEGQAEEGRHVFDRTGGRPRLRR